MSLVVLQADCKRAVNSLTDLSNDELDDIMNNDGKIEELIANLNQSYIKEIESEKETVLVSNSSLAEFNLTREPELVEARERVVELSEEGERLTKLVEDKTKELRDKGGDMSLETALALLQTAASEMEEESDGVAKKFLSNDLEIEDFLDDFLSKRKIMHLRLVKAEKMSKILSRDPILSNVPNYINAPPVNINSNYFPGIPVTSSVPYPTGPLNMPMPNVNYFQNHY